MKLYTKKPLEWEESHPQIGTRIFEDYECDTPLGIYKIHQTGHSHWKGYLRKQGFVHDIFDNIMNIEQAKAACQEDYDKRLDACLEEIDIIEILKKELGDLKESLKFEQDWDYADGKERGFEDAIDFIDNLLNK